MPKVDIINVSGQQVGDIELSENIFGAEINASVLHEVVKNYLANQRQGTQSAKTRAEVRGGGRKPWRQKGTGRARQGSTRSPQWVGGGVVFAPKPRDYRYTLPKKVKRLAMKSALSSKVKESEMIVLDELALETFKTKDMINILSNVKAGKKALIVLPEVDEKVIKSASNIPGVTTTIVGALNVYDILNHNNFIVTKEAVAKIEEVYA
ncbi:MAG: 50S ribosomal protein L4 [Anaeromicrobium sp.]|jgi:large subunit ribosomal protein L4|uniref:50S ribosomal protein L4 n=1 Tax=Anaeromicrobium sp. TaxID=1929132 RepID=UPI0025D16F29|nr:50S ribosomal protein L4 [Anaeromicrobium sp.]MCT4594492.1 50S ribosomal protein L4 [Anaeromicrobium sp.]